MKTSVNYQSDFPSPKKFIAYLILVCVLAFACCLASKAQTIEKSDRLAYKVNPVESNADLTNSKASYFHENEYHRLSRRLQKALVPIPDEDIELESWMLDAVKFCERFGVEYNREPESTDGRIYHFRIRTVKENPLELEIWMTDPSTFGIQKVEEVPWEVAEWMNRRY